MNTKQKKSYTQINSLISISYILQTYSYVSYIDPEILIMTTPYEINESWKFINIMIIYIQIKLQNNIVYLVLKLKHTRSKNYGVFVLEKNKMKNFVNCEIRWYCTTVVGTQINSTKSQTNKNGNNKLTKSQTDHYSIFSCHKV